MTLPTIVHLDADAFFVSVEQALHPELRGKKVAVGGRQRGIISSASYEARACGVYTPMPTTRARKVCPDLIIVGHTSGLYSQYSKRLFDLCEQVTPLVERNSIDEGYMDIEPCRFRTLPEIEAAISNLQGRIWEQLGITVSFGIASNKLVAAIASKLRKPRGFVVVRPGEEAEFLFPLSIGKLPGVGTKTEEFLNSRGIKFVSDLFERSEDELHELFGSGWREMLARARGEDDRVVDIDPGEAKSYSQQETFGADISDFGEIEKIAKRMLDELMRKVRADGKRVRTLTIKVRYSNFEQNSAAHSLGEATELEAPFYPFVSKLLRQAWKRRSALRLVSVKLSGVDDQPEQLEIFSEETDKRKRLAATIDALKALRGEDVVQRAGQLGNPNEKPRRKDRGMEGFQRPGM
ncbi:MAG TPA: DNA polymerase IV [Opitutaceae bacterium]|nr:DNA polymerase IV [Opitutaceae bacterium]